MIGGRMVVPTRARGGGLIRPAALAVVLLVCLLAVGRLVPEPTHVREVVALSVIVLIAGVAAYSPPLLLPTLALWLAALGFVRRLVTEVGVPNKLDPLLLVGPLGLALLGLWGMRRIAGRPPTNLMKAVFVLSALILIGALNPRGGSLFGGVAGLLFVLVPTFGYWVGRAIDDRVLSWTFKMVAALGLAAAAYGLTQTIVGFPSWDQRWIDQVSFASLNVNGVIRPFASFTSAQEYALYIAIAIVIWIGAAFRIRYLVLSALALSLLIPALVLESSRGAIVSLVVAIGAMLGARRRLPLLLAAGVGIALLAALAFGLRSYGPSTSPSAATTTSGQLISHDVAGLSDPLNPQASTVGVHLSLVVNGVKSAFSDPVGRGIGAVDDRRPHFRRRDVRNRGGSVEHGGRARPAGVDRIRIRPCAGSASRLSHRLRPSRPARLDRARDRDHHFLAVVQRRPLFRRVPAVARHGVGRQR